MREFKLVYNVPRTSHTLPISQAPQFKLHSNPCHILGVNILKQCYTCIMQMFASLVNYNLSSSSGFRGAK